MLIWIGRLKDWRRDFVARRYDLRRWPKSVYSSGSEPDYRFSFANERTFLAWVRTALALLAGGVALDAVSLSISDHMRHFLAIALIVLGVTCACLAWIRWARAERAMRLSDPLPGFGQVALVLSLSGAVVLLLALLVAVTALAMPRV